MHASTVFVISIHRPKPVSRLHIVNLLASYVTIIGV